jgi:DnaA family protein
VRQLPLDVRLADHAVFASFYAGSNELAVESARRLAAGQGLHVVWLHGARDTGKSHLLQSAVAEAHAKGASSTYLPLRALRGETPELLAGFETAAVVALDDVDAVAGDPGWERRLFSLFEGIAAAGGGLLMAAANPPAHAGFALPDLASRFGSGAVFRLAPLSDADCRRALQHRAAWRGLVLPEETAAFLLARVERGVGSLFGLLDRLDRAALAAQRSLTVPFVRSVLESDAASRATQRRPPA